MLFRSVSSEHVPILEQSRFLSFQVVWRSTDFHYLCLRTRAIFTLESSFDEGRAVSEKPILITTVLRLILIPWIPHFIYVLYKSNSSKSSINLDPTECLGTIQGS